MSRTARVEKELPLIGSIPWDGIMLDIHKVGKYCLISALPHVLRFDMGSYIGLLPGIPELAEFVKAESQKTIMVEFDPGFVKCDYKFSPEIVKTLDSLRTKAVSKVQDSVSIVSSIIGVQAISNTAGFSYPPLLVAPITTTETCRLANDLKLCYTDQWSV